MELPKILYVDDEKPNLMLFEINYSDRYQVLQAVNGMEGLEVYSRNSDIKVVISDMKMPLMNGLEFISRVREINPEAKCYILTGYSINDEIKEFISKGLILDCLTKPLDFAQFGKELDRLVTE